MKTTTVRGLTATPGEQRPATSPPQESSVTELTDGRVTRRRSSSWDPYEVWRTRVKAEQTPEDDAEASSAA